jgi:Na+/melibiose symporter-like transporter
MSKVKEKITLKKMFQVIAKNDQLLWSALALMFYSIGSNLLVALGYNFFWLEIGYDPSQTMIFIISFAVSNIGIQSLYSTLAKHFTRKQLMTFSFIALAFGYVVMLSLGWWPGFLPVNLLTACIFGFFIFGGQAIFYMVVIVNMTNTIEYNEYKTGSRNEAIVFSLRPFIAKLSSALEMLVVTLVLVVSGVYAMSQNVSELESQKSMFEEMTEVEQIALINSISITNTDGNPNVGIIPAITYDQYSAMSATDKTNYIDSIKNKVVTLANLDTESDDGQERFITLYYALQDADNLVYTYYTDPLNSANDGWIMNVNTAADSVFHDRVAEETMPRVILRISITVLPVILILTSMLIMNKKFIITEAYYEMITAETKKRQDAEAAIEGSPVEA